MRTDRPRAVRSAGSAAAGPRSREAGRALLVLIPLLLFLAACAPARRAPLPPPLPKGEAEALAARLADHNRTLVDFKGLGTVTLGGAGGRAARVAWAGSRPGRLRIDVLGGGLPAASVAGDGERFFLRQNRSGRVLSRPAVDPGLAPLLGLPVTVGDVLEALVGRVPEVPHDAVSAHADAAAGGVVLVLRQRWMGERARVRLADDGRSAQEVAVFGVDGGLRYRIAYRGSVAAGAFQVPRRIVIADDARTCTLEVERFWADAPVDPGAFVLERPRME